MIHKHSIDRCSIMRGPDLKNECTTRCSGRAEKPSCSNQLRKAPQKTESRERLSIGDRDSRNSEFHNDSIALYLTIQCLKVLGYPRSKTDISVAVAVTF